MVATFKEVKGNKVGDIPATDVYIDVLFAGVGNSADGKDEQVCTDGGGSSQKINGSTQGGAPVDKACYTSAPSAKNKCEKDDGVIKGKGPFCVDDEEQAALDITNCYYVEGLKCIKEYGRTTQGGASGGGAGGCCLSYQNALEKVICDDAFRTGCAQAGQQATQDCNDLGGTAPGCEGTASKPMGTAERAKCTQDFCAKVGAKANTDCMEAPFKPVKACYDKAKEVYDKCIKKIDNKCDCKNCIWQVVDPCADCPDDDDDDDDDETDVDPDDPHNINQFKTQSCFCVIPRVFGRYIVTGNVIWIGNVIDQTITYTLDYDNGDSAEVTDLVTKVDILIGVALGEVQNLMRMWAGQMLIYNATLDLSEDSTNNGTTDIDLAPLAPNDYSMVRMAAYKPTIEFFTGSATQNVIETYATSEGYGRVPAHRGLALVLLRDVDIALFGNGFPDFKFDIMSTYGQDVLPNVVSATQSDMATDYMEVDTRTETIYLDRGDVTTLLNSNNLENEYDADTPDAATRLVTKSGHLLYDDGMNVKLVDPFRNRELVDYGTAFDISDHSDSMLAIGGGFFSFDAIFLQATDGELTVLDFDYSQDLGGEFDMTYAGLAGVTLVDSLVTMMSNVYYLYQFFVANTGDAISVRRITLTEDAVLQGDLDVAIYSVDPDAFSGATGIDYVRAMRDTTDNTFVVFVNTAASGNFVFKLDTDIEVVWSAPLTVTLPTWSPVGEIRSRLHTPTFVFIDGDQNLVRLNLSDGSYELIDYLPSRSLPNLGGAQFYEGANDSVIYQTDDDRVARVYPARITPEKVSLATVMRQLIAETRFDPTLLDLSDVEDVTFDGYLIDSKITIAEVVDSLGKLYQVSFSDDGYKIRMLKDLSILSSPETRDYYVADSLHTSRAITTEYLDTASCQFVNLTDVGLVEMKQTVTLKPDVEQTEIPTTEDFQLNLNETAANIRIALERILLNEIANRNTIEIGLFPRDLQFCPRDAIIWDGTIYRITQTLIDTTDQIRLIGVRYDRQVLDNVIDLSPAPLSNERLITRPRRKLPYRPVVLFTNAINESDVATAQQGNRQVVYTGIEAPTLDITSTAFKFRLLPATATFQLSGGRSIIPRIDPTTGSPIGIETGPPITLENDAIDNGSMYYKTQIHTKGLHSGVVVTAPHQLGPDGGNGSIPQFKTDVDETLVVKFDFPETLDEFVAGLDKYAVLELPTTNLLIIGREYLQFDQWDVDMDGLTVTFTRLYRGKQGTETYINTHSAGDKVYLYTADTFKTSVIDPHWTARQQLCSIVVGTVSVAGTPDLAWTKRSDAGSARPWPPVGIKLRSVEADGSGGYVMRIRHRSPYRSDFNQTGGRLQTDTGDYTIVGFRGETPDLEEFEERIIRNFDEITLEEDLIFKVDVLAYDPDNQDPDPLSASSVGISDLLFDPSLSDFPYNTIPHYIAVMALKNGSILGHPTFRRLPKGAIPEDIFRP